MSWQSTILISVVVTLFSSLGILLIDYLFIDILSAPTTASIKSANSPTIRAQISRQLLSLGGESVKQQPPSRLTRATSTLKDSLLLETEVRILPPELIEAHAEAVSSFGSSLGETQEKMKVKFEHRQSQRFGRLTQFQRQTSKTSGENELRQPSLAEEKKDQLTSDELLTSLLIEIKEERGKFKRETERQTFDSLWG